MHLTSRTSSLVLVAALFAAACSGANTAGGPGSSGPGSGGDDGAGGGTGGGAQGDGGSTDGDTVSVTIGVGGSSGSGTSTCDSAGDEDRDQDGITKDGGDCNDCDANVNPNAIEVVVTEVDPETGEVPEAADEDCDGTVDNLPAQSCDQGIVLESTNATDGARAIELCQGAPESGGGWGVISAGYMRANGTPVPSSTQFGIQANYGPQVLPQGGGSMLNLSSGRARLPGQSNACGSCACGGASGQVPDASAFPQTSPNCGGGPGSPIYDDIAFEVRLRAPSNATGFSFDFFFYTFEYPDYLCSAVNDQFIAWMQPPPAAAPNGNISFDTSGNPISVNAAFFQVCNYPAGANTCALGGGQMTGTGFDSWSCGADDGEAGGTGWLTTQAPVTPGQEFTIRFAVWDTGDSILDSTVLVDNFRWIANGGTVVVGTTPAGPPN